jgi:hypothetical protein
MRLSCVIRNTPKSCFAVRTAADHEVAAWLAATGFDEKQVSAAQSEVGISVYQKPQAVKVALMPRPCWEIEEFFHSSGREALNRLRQRGRTADGEQCPVGLDLVRCDSHTNNRGRTRSESQYEKKPKVILLEESQARR